MILQFEEQNINMFFEVTEEGKLLLLSCSNKKRKFNENDKEYNVCSAVAIHIAGENPDDHHGAKHTGTSCEKTLKYVKHSYYKNEQGNTFQVNLILEKPLTTSIALYVSIGSSD